MLCLSTTAIDQSTIAGTCVMGNIAFQEKKGRTEQYTTDICNHYINQQGTGKVKQWPLKIMNPASQKLNHTSKEAILLLYRHDLFTRRWKNTSHSNM